MPPAQTENEKTAGESGLASGGAPDLGSPAVRYGLAVVAVVLAAGAKWLLDPALEAESPFLLFIVAIVVGAWFGGLGPGLFATGLALVACNYLFLAPLYSFRIDTSGACSTSCSSAGWGP